MGGGRCAGRVEGALPFRRGGVVVQRTPQAQEGAARGEREHDEGCPGGGAGGGVLSCSPARAHARRRGSKETLVVPSSARFREARGCPVAPRVFFPTKVDGLCGERVVVRHRGAGRIFCCVRYGRAMQPWLRPTGPLGSTCTPVRRFSGLPSLLATLCRESWSDSVF